MLTNNYSDLRFCKMTPVMCSVNLKTMSLLCFKKATLYDIHNYILDTYNLSSEDYYLLKNGKKLNCTDSFEGTAAICHRLVGGKGGFGSMLRAIGAQIEKTTNREACRDLSGRRLRDINEEQRLKNWIAQQADREREAAERKRKKLESLCREPKHDFKDEKYEQERSELTDNVYNSVEEGFKKAGSSGTSLKRASATVSSKLATKKKKKLWIDADDSLSSSSENEISSDSKSSEVVAKETLDSCSTKTKPGTESGVLKDLSDVEKAGSSGTSLKRTSTVACIPTKKKKILWIDADSLSSSSEDESSNAEEIVNSHSTKTQPGTKGDVLNIVTDAVDADLESITATSDLIKSDNT